MTAIVTQGDARSIQLPDDSVDLIVTSPPYWGLRSYQDGGEHYDAQIGAEATPGEYVDALIDCTAEWMRVLKPEASLWVNLGDKYGPDKSLLGLPWQYALRCRTDLGLILRAEVIWCLSGGARVYARTKSGDRPVMLRDLVRAYRPEDVKVWNGEKWTQVLGWNRSPDHYGALEIELRTGERIGCTTGHRWPTQRGVIRADEIRVGDVIQTTRLPEPDSPHQPAALDDEDIGWLVGLYIAEGSRSEKTLQFAGHRREEARHVRLNKIAAAFHGNSAVYQTSENGVTCNLNGAALLGIIDHYIGRGRTSKSKRLRKTVWQRSDQFLAALVDGYLSGDGHFDAKNNRWRLGFGANDEWAADLRTLAARLGAKLSLRRHGHMFQGRTYPGWRGEWRWERSLHHSAKQDGEVVAIRKSRAREFYDLGVTDEPHLFALASGVLTHNSKPNGLPESVTDRTRRSHEQWFHFVQQPRYFSAVDEIRDPASGYSRPNGNGRQARGGQKPRLMADTCNPLGRLPGSVWEIATQPLTVPPHLGVDHFAAFPLEWPRRIIRGWSPSGICTACGQGRRPVVTKATLGRDNSYDRSHRATADSTRWVALKAANPDRITGYACACPDATAPTRPSIVVDPFGGTGTTALVADVLGRTGISIDASADYCRIARWRTTDPGERARALGVPKPPVELPGQQALFELGAS